MVISALYVLDCFSFSQSIFKLFFLHCLFLVYSIVSIILFCFYLNGYVNKLFMSMWVSSLHSGPLLNLSNLTLCYFSVSLPKPNITIQPTGVVMWGQDVHITCSITGVEAIGSFIFTKIPGPFTQTVDSSSNSAILHIHQVNFTNEGSYQCQFQRRDSSSVFSDNVNLNVTGKCLWN